MAKPALLLLKVPGLFHHKLRADKVRGEGFSSSRIKNVNSGMLNDRLCLDFWIKNRVAILSPDNV